MKQTKTIGVVIPIYNVEKYLKECLDSVINQTYTNLEIILVNDGSTDENSLNIAKEYTLKDKRITLFDKKNGGLSSARNVGIEYFSGEYKLKNKTQTIKENSLIEFNIEGNNPYEIYTVYKSYKAFNNEQDLISFTYPIIDYIIFLDSDDYWELNCIEECVPRMDGVDVVWFDYSYYYDGIIPPNILPSTIFEKHYNAQKIVSSKEFFINKLEVGYRSLWFGWHGMIDFIYLKKINLKFIDKILHEDHYFGKLLFFQSSFIYILNQKLITYRIRKDSIMNYSESVSYIPKYMKYYYNFFDKNYFAYKQYHRKNSLFLTALMVLLFIKENENLPNIDLIKKIFLNKLKLWRDGIFEFDRKYLKDVLFFSVKDFFSLSRDVNLNSQIISEFIADNTEKYIDQVQYLNAVVQNKDKFITTQTAKINSLQTTLKENEKKLLKSQNLSNTLNQTIKEKDQLINSKSIQLNQIQSKLSFQTKYGTAKTRIQNQLSYKLGQAMIVNSKSILGYIRMPFVLSYIKDKHKQEQKIYQEKIKKDPSLKLPQLEDYPDYQEALKEKECLTYKLGQTLIQANKTWYKGGYVKMWFEIRKLKRELYIKKDIR